MHLLECQAPGKRSRASTVTWFPWSKRSWRTLSGWSSRRFGSWTFHQKKLVALRASDEAGLGEAEGHETKSSWLKVGHAQAFLILAKWRFEQ
jgi:hypothetical protein